MLAEESSKPDVSAPSRLRHWETDKKNPKFVLSKSRLNVS